VSTSLYRHFAEDGTLLYVGISLSWPARTRQHAQTARWFDQVAKVEIEHFPTREAALGAEREAIKREKPQFNIMHNRGSEPGAPKVWGSAWRREKRHFDDPLLKSITGPDAIVGPALVYGEDQVSLMVAHGEPGTVGNLTEVQLGRFADIEPPEWAHLAASIISIRRANDITLEEAREVRGEIVAKLREHLRKVDICETDLSLAVAYASTFPGPKSRKVLDDIAVERGAR
jgi:hypothetical protein